MLVCSQETKDLYVAAGKGNCGKLPTDASVYHFAYPIAGIVNEVKKLSAQVGAHRTDANGSNLVDRLAYTDDNFDLDKSITRDAMSSVYAPLIEYTKGVGQAYLYDNDCYKTHKVKFNRGYEFYTEYAVSEFDKSITLKLISNKAIPANEYVLVTADVAYKVIGITGEERGESMVLSHKFLNVDTYTTITKAVEETTDEPCVVTRREPERYCLHHRGLPCNNLGMFNTEYCHNSCRCYAEGVGLGNSSSSSSTGSATEETTTPATVTYYVYSIKLTPAYNADEVDNGLGGERVENIIVPKVDARAYSTAPVMVAKGDWLEVEYPNGTVEMYVCHTACTTNNKFGCPTYYAFMHADLRHTIHYVLFFPQLSNKANLQAADQQIHDALVDYCCYRWFSLVKPDEAEQYYTRYLSRLEMIQSFLDAAPGSLYYTTPRYV